MRETKERPDLPMSTDHPKQESKLLDYREIRQRVIDAGYEADITWAESVAFPKDADAFASEVVFVICNSGMKATVARPIYEKVIDCLWTYTDPATVFNHKLKCRAILDVWRRREQLYGEFESLRDDATRLAWLGNLDHIGGITKYHLAKNFGLNVAKPDRHLQRIADHAGTTPQELCERLAKASGDRVGTVDVVLWRASSLGIIDTKNLAALQSLKESTP